ncbi:MAG: hypothetical protein HY367_04050 [Candidatus Aenigmarchaeota archaeon]|nr:hypothetical protein [Candidatus Aenigmarchaeota archaeon]
MKKDLTAQVFSAVIAVVLLITFYILLLSDFVRGTQANVTPMILIIIAIILLAIFSVLHKMECGFEMQQMAKPLAGGKKSK